MVRQRGFRSLVLLLIALLTAVTMATGAPETQRFALEPEPTQLLASTAARVPLCALAPSSFNSSSSSWRWRWHLEGCEYAEQNDTASLPKLASFSGRATSRPFGLLYDSEDGRLTVVDDSSANVYDEPQCRLFCEAASADGGYVIQSRRSALRIVNPSSVEARLECVSGPASGTAVCSLVTQPLPPEEFSVTYYRWSFSYSQEERLPFSPDSPKYAAFDKGFNRLHILNLSLEDARYSYFARVTLALPGEVAAIVKRTHHLPIQLLQASSSSVEWRPQQSRVVVARRFVAGEEGGDILLPCYVTNAAAGMGRYSWSKDGLPLAQPLSPKYSMLLPMESDGLSSSDGSLRLRPDGQRDSGVYSCSFNGRLVHEIELKLYSPLSASIRPASLSVDLGANISIGCEIRGWPVDRVRWLHNGRQLSAESSASRQQRWNGSWSTLTISGAGRGQPGVYQCLPERTGGQGGASQVPFDSAQASALLTVDKLPPVLIRKIPGRSSIMMQLNGSDPRASGTVTCVFDSPQRPTVELLLDSSQQLFGDFESSGVFRVTRRTYSNRVLEVKVTYRVTQLEHTGTLSVDAVTSFGKSGCSTYLLGITEPPRLEVRPLADMHALVDGSFVIDCHVLGGLNSLSVDSELAGQDRPPTYRLSWQLLADGSRQPLRLPKDHRTQVDSRARPNRLLVTRAEPVDSGVYSCTPTLDPILMQQPHQDSPVLQPGSSASARVKVVPGIRAKELNRQGDLDTEMSISDTCRPVNQQTDVWYAWWEFVNSSSDGRPPRKQILLDPRVVKYLAIDGGSQHADTTCQSSGLADRFFKIGVPEEVRRKWARHEANLDIRLPYNLHYQGVFTCRIVNCYDQVALSRRVKYKEEYSFKPGSPPNSREVVVGSPLTVHCALTQSEPGTPAVIWYLGNAVHRDRRVPIYSKAPASGSSSSRIYQFPNGTLHIVRIEREDSSFLCATDVSNRRHLRSATFNPNILVPAVVKPFPTNRLVLIAGSNDTVSCEADGDKPIKIEWIGFYEGGGNAECRLGPEVITTENCRPDRILPASASASTSAIASAPAPVSRYASISVADEGARLVLTNVNRGVRGRFDCLARNRHSPDGRPSSRSIEVHVVERPGQVGSFGHTGRGHDWVMLQWEPPPQASPSAGNDVASYRLEYRLLPEPDKGVNSVESNLTGTTLKTQLPAEDKSYRVEGLRPGGSYEFSLVAENKAGSGPPATCHAETWARPPSGPARHLTVRPLGTAALRVAWEPPEAAVRNGRIIDYSLAVRPLPAPDREAECIAASADVADSTVRCPGPAAVVGQIADNSSAAAAAACHGAAAATALQAGTVYQVRLAPLNSAGAGPPVCAVARTPETTPSSPPASVSCESSPDGRLLVTWLPPPAKPGTNDGEFEYQVLFMPAEDAAVENESRLIEISVLRGLHPDREQRRLQMELGRQTEGLQAYTSYSFAVTASNAKGRSPRSRPPAVCRTDPARPSPPEDLRVVAADNGRVAVAAWRVCPPQRANGRLIGYRLKYTCFSGCNGASSSSMYVDHPATAWSHYEHRRIEGLRPGSQYSFCVSAIVESIGEGDCSPDVRFVAVETPQLSIVSYSHHFKVPNGSSLMLDCYAVGRDRDRLQWTHPVLDKSPTVKLQNGSALIRKVLMGGLHTCGIPGGPEKVEYTVELLDLHTNPTPPPPELLPGQRTASSLEVLWRPRGIGLDSHWLISGGAGGNFTSVSNRSRLREFELHSKALGGGSPESVRVLPASNRSFALDPLPCGTEVEFRLRAVNVGGLKSEFSQKLRQRVPGSAPEQADWARAPTAPPLARLGRRGRSLDFNLSSVLPGNNCPPALYRLRVHSDDFEPADVELMPRQLVGGCCHSLRLTVRPGQRTGRQQLIRYSVVAENAAGQLPLDGVVEVDAVVASSAAEVINGAGGGSGGSAPSGTSGEPLLSGRTPVSPVHLPDGQPGASERQPVAWPNWWQQVALVSALAMLLLLGLITLTAALLCRRQQRRPSSGSPTGRAGGTVSGGSGGAARNVKSGQPACLPAVQRAGGRQQRPQPPPTPSMMQQQTQQQQQQQQAAPALAPAKAPTPALGAAPAPQPSLAPSVPYEYEDDRESVDSRGNIRAYATFDADKGGSSTAGGRRRSQQQPPQLSAAAARVRRAAYENGASRRLQQRQLSASPGVAAALHLMRVSRVSSATTLSSNHDELSEAYHRAQQLRALPPTESYEEEEEEEDSGDSGATDPGIRRFTSRPPDPNEKRRAACEMLRTPTDPSVQPPPRRPVRHCRPPRSVAGAPPT
ncbi:hypothetical protein BOX15_Mlig033441g2 [Macrostomum lignano]|uniref:Down syndrome cell adhesion molecule-like protein Dscam2 n=1 Tax=Macrostomum lignano TaxID=282301 RepID=A0A267E5W0_9PLAT|nr:hypothetical protein BOX15_Mlig033441g2 [Macrostomum lignano]